MAKTVDQPKCILLCNSFVMSNSRYSPLIWMFCVKTANKEISRVHKRALRILLRDYDASFGELCVKNEEKTVHVQNLQILMIEVYKALNHQSPSILWEAFAMKEINHSLRINHILPLSKALKTSFGTNSISFRYHVIM